MKNASIIAIKKPLLIKLIILFATGFKMPVRKIPKSYRSVTGIVSDSVSDMGYSFESTLERDFFLLLKFDKSVQSFEEQPLQINWTDKAGKPRRYTPDARADYVDNRPPTIFEVKYRSDLKKNWNDLKPKFKAAIIHCRSHGMHFKIITEQEIRTPLLKNVRFLTHYQNLLLNQHLTEYHNRIINLIEQLSQTTPSNLLHKLTKDEWEQAAIMPVLWYLIANGEIEANLTEPLGMESEIRSA